MTALSTSAHCLLHELAMLRVGGRDARAFLQGQVSNDVGRLDVLTPLRAGLHTPQGRVLALLHLWSDGEADEAVLAALPLELAATISGHLRRYVLRAQVSIDDVSGEWRVLGVRDSRGGLSRRPLRAAQALPQTTLDNTQWAALEIAAGLPEVHVGISGEFVAQMLNLDCIDAIAWDKGCYTGQEIIARAHYRGQVKRRMRRFVCAGSGAPAPGTSLETSDGVAVRVVRSTGAGEMLAVAPLDARSRDELPLPYTVP